MLLVADLAAFTPKRDLLQRDGKSSVVANEHVELQGGAGEMRERAGAEKEKRKKAAARYFFCKAHLAVLNAGFGCVENGLFIRGKFQQAKGICFPGRNVG